jgi:hypothetical protein
VSAVARAKATKIRARRAGGLVSLRIMLRYCA